MTHLLLAFSPARDLSKAPSVRLYRLWSTSHICQNHPRPPPPTSQGSHADAISLPAPGPVFSSAVSLSPLPCGEPPPPFLTLPSSLVTPALFSLFLLHFSHSLSLSHSFHGALFLSFPVGNGTSPSYSKEGDHPCLPTVAHKHATHQ